LLHSATWHSGQRQICWPRPLSDGVITGCGEPFSVSTCSLSISAFIAKAVPVSVWHEVQWQQWTNIGARFKR
jgi:hypothetical protein